MKKKRIKKDIGHAELKAALVKNKCLSLKRLEHDYNEIKNQIIPIPGVSACPLDDNFYEWHGNIKCLRDNVYKGAVLHLKFIFPKDYPLSPPTVYVLNSNIIHPNVLSDGRICLDILEKVKDNYIGWRSGYTVLTILSQLQNFFFDINKTFLINEKEEENELELMELKEREDRKQEEKEEKEKEEKENENRKEKKKEKNKLQKKKKHLYSNMG